jgi:hypothetical protein
MDSLSARSARRDEHEAAPSRKPRPHAQRRPRACCAPGPHPDSAAGELLDQAAAGLPACGSHSDEWPFDGREDAHAADALARQATDGVLRLPYSPAARFHLVDLQDVARVVGEVAADPDRHMYATYELAGPERLSSTEMAERVAQATGRHLRVEELPTTSLPLPPALPRTMIAEMLAMFAKYDHPGTRPAPTSFASCSAGSPPRSPPSPSASSRTARRAVPRR